MNWFARNAAYCRYLFLHKAYVFRAGLITGAPIHRLLIHDWSKMRPSEWIAYREYFYGEKTPEVRDAFDRAWLSHIHWNKHHWDHWCAKDGDKFKPLAMPDKYIREMVADWAGAGRAIHGKWDLQEWYTKNSADMLLHPQARIAVEYYLYELKNKLTSPGGGK